MGARFLTGTQLFEYEMMMQELPHMQSRIRVDKTLMKRYYRLIERLIHEQGYGSIKNRIIKSVKKMYFDDFMFADEEHEQRFNSAYTEKLSTKERNNNDIVSVIYLLSADNTLCKELSLYLEGKRFLLLEKTGNVGVKGYNLFKMAQRISGNEEAFPDDDIKEPEIIDDEVLCIVVNALFISKYGIRALYEEEKTEKHRYVNKSKFHNSKYRTYTYKNQAVKIKM